MTAAEAAAIEKYLVPSCAHICEVASGRMANNNLTHIEVRRGGVRTGEGECSREGYILFIIHRKHSSALHSQPFKAGSFCLPPCCKLNEPNAAAAFLVHSQSLASACWLIRELRAPPSPTNGSKTTIHIHVVNI